MQLCGCQRALCHLARLLVVFWLVSGSNVNRALAIAKFKFVCYIFDLFIFDLFRSNEQGTTLVYRSKKIARSGWW